MTRASTLYASAYDAERSFDVRLVNGSRRPLRVELNGVLPMGVTVSSVDWNVRCQGAVSIDTPAISDRSFSAWIVAMNCGRGEIDATATTNDGQVMVFRINVVVQ